MRDHRQVRPPVTRRTPSTRAEKHIPIAEFEDCGWSATLPGGQVTSTDLVRQAKLRPECAECYPSLPALMWTSATRLAGLVASYRGARPGTAGKGRTLPESDFEFRGGFPRGLSGLLWRTRTGEVRV